MADFSQNDRNMIAKHPLKGALDHLRETLENVEQSYKCNPTPYELTDDQGPKKALSRLLAASMGHEVAGKYQGIQLDGLSAGDAIRVGAV
jgi:hypothetical protein